ncbi:cytochrome c oxidase assembly protein [Granulicella sibirica]|uniref:CtaG protein n=1 Tax=Granulicella sibirica TaxID=2479048 RepID=A0A4Q0SWH8_9BACT|nr:cytochrome c oxidase assembly protein [Granulicella sibirica]RXH54782.1 CtaG protein [Granulicella sibirica]
MSDAAQAIFLSWSPPPWLTLSVALTAIVYLRGWLEIGKTRPQQFDLLRLASFYSGLAVLWLAIASPMDGFADVLLSAHMIEHLLLMSVVPPLLLYGLPVVPLLRGLPVVLRRNLIGPLLRLTFLRRFLHWLTRPVVAWFAMNISFLAWHIPSAYNFALEHENWHAVEHICFLGTSILFWWCIIRPWPSEAKRLNWGILLYLVSADVVNTILSAFLSFCDRPVYSFYLTHPNPFQVEPLEDQVLGAVIMWVLGSLAFLLPAVILALHLVRGDRSNRA